MKRNGNKRYNRIWVVSGAILAVLLSLFSIRSAFISAVALEQTARCGAEEHLHTTACYEGSTLCCSKAAHTHNRNCYLVLLQDNDINNLLNQVGSDRSRNLETLIHQTVGTALQYNTNLTVLNTEQSFVNLTAQHILYTSQPTAASTSEEPETTAVDTVDIASLNETITEQSIEPGIVLNENLYNADTTSETPSDTVMLLGTDSSSGGVSTLALGDTSTDSQKANFYVQLDGTWTCFGITDLQIQTSNNGWWTEYAPYLNTGSMFTFINSELSATLDPDAAYSSDSITMRYATSARPNNWSAVTIGGTTTTFGSSYNTTTASYARHIRLYDSNGNALSYYTVTLNYPDGTSATHYVRSGETFTLPAGYAWTSGSTSYDGGTSVTITSQRTFTGTVTDGRMRVSYNVSFPTSGYSYYYTVYAPTSPTLMGTTTTTLQDTIEDNASTTVRSISATTVYAETSHPKDFTYPIHFLGWQTETGELLSPDTTLTWAELEAYANGDRTVSLTGVWSHGRQNTVNFFVLHHADVDQTTGNANDYTTSIYTSFMDGTIDTSVSYNATDDTVAYENDQAIRAMYGPASGTMWLDTFPSDEYIFQQLRNHVSDLTVDGEQVDIDDLNSSAYAIRWYMLKYDGSDGWHIDGKLTRKKGQITVDKEFFGDDGTITQAESGFHLVAVNGTVDSDGVFTAYTPSNTDYHQYVLVLTEADKTTLAATYPNADFLVYDSTADFSDGEGFEWLIEGVELDEYWQITEHPVDVPGNMYYAEYSVYDTDGNTSAVAKYGTTASVVGRTFALDEDPDQGLLVDFRNYYYPEESILIKKEDKDTGQPIGGATFELWQEHDGALTQLKFSYNATTKQYQYDNNGSITQISTGDAGFTTITTTGFSYSHGPVTAKEVIAPTGYAAAPNITLAESGSTVVITDMQYEDGTAVPESQWNDFGEVHDDGSVLVVKDQVSDLTSVTANKVWADSTRADSVTLVLQANGTTATNLFPGLANVRAVLNDANSWQYTWTDLPTYANGAPVEWSVKEILVGAEPPLIDGSSFANWTVVYSPPVRTDADYDGITDHWQCTVTNSVRRAQLYLVKTDGSSTYLPGAAFELIEVDVYDNPVSDAVARTGTTDGSGLLRFDNLKYATRYRLTETSPPDGYKAFTEPAYLTLAADGTVTVESHSHVTAGASAYVVNAVNYAPLPLPETGGSGPGAYSIPGALLMLLAGCGYILLSTQKRGRRQSG